MLQSLTAEARPSPPPRLRPVGEITWAAHSLTIPPFAKRPVNNDTDARKAGRRYERRVHDHFLERYPLMYVASPWICFCDRRAVKHYSWCQPDGWLIDFERGLITIIEVKINHTPDAWWQIKHLYEPVTRFLFGNSWRYAACEVVKWYDPATHFPARVNMTPDPSTLWNGAFGVHVWRP